MFLTSFRERWWFKRLELKLNKKQEENWKSKPLILSRTERDPGVAHSFKPNGSFTTSSLKWTGGKNTPLWTMSISPTETMTLTNMDIRNYMKMRLLWVWVVVGGDKSRCFGSSRVCTVGFRVVHVWCSTALSEWGPGLSPIQHTIQPLSRYLVYSILVYKTYSDWFFTTETQ